ncbi:MAG: hypothetical protein LBE27_02965 [Deltaproteobacteria bacterium]|jgi:hypothetical protein|nr:hypothetical protein [Deltaproteobacteria bacterium]
MPKISTGLDSLQKALKLCILTLVLTAFASGCFLTMNRPFLKERDLEKGVIPKLSGRWKDEEGATLTIKDTKFTNSFTAVSTDKNAVLKISMERLDDRHFIIQFQPEGEKGVFLTVGEVTDKRISLYTFPDNLPELTKKALANGVTINQIGLITKYTQAQGIIKFFHEMAATPGHVDFILTKY